MPSYVDNVPTFEALVLMKIHLITIGTKMPKWIQLGFNEYQKRLPKECTLQLKEIPLLKRTKNTSIENHKKIEAEQLIQSIPKNCHTIALDSTGHSFSTNELSNHLKNWMGEGINIAFLVGGPDGLDQQCLQFADKIWSLSMLTFPHPLVRIVVAEQIYRAWSLTQNHPYHR